MAPTHKETSAEMRARREDSRYMDGHWEARPNTSIGGWAIYNGSEDINEVACFVDQDDARYIAYLHNQVAAVVQGLGRKFHDENQAIENRG